MSSGWAAWPEVGEMMYFGLLRLEEDVDVVVVVVGSFPSEEEWFWLEVLTPTPMPTPDVEGGKALGMGL